MKTLGGIVLVVAILAGYHFLLPKWRDRERQERNAKYYTLIYFTGNLTDAPQQNRWECVTHVKTSPNGRFTYVEWENHLGVTSNEPHAENVLFLKSPVETVDGKARWCEE